MESEALQEIIPEVKRSCVQRVKDNIQLWLKNTSRRLAKSVCNNPKKTIAIYCVVLVISLLGFLRVSSLKNNDITDLFTPGDSESHTERVTYDDLFTKTDDSVNIIAVPTRKGGILSNTDALVDLLEIEKELMDITVDGHTYDDFCYRMADDSCMHFSPFMYFDWNRETVELTGDKVNKVCTSSLNYIPFYYIFGSSGHVNNTNCEDPATGVAKGTAFSIVFGLSFEKFNKTIPDKWMDEAISLLKEHQDGRYWELYFTSSYGLSNEVERGTLTTLTKIVVSIILVMIMLVFAFHDDSYVVSVQLSVVTMACCLVASGMGLGISLLLGLPWTTITPVILFLSIGLGVDNMVLLTILFYRGDRSRSLKHRAVHAVGEASLFNTLSTVTTVLAFLMGVNSSFKGIRTFCLSSALVMSSVFVSTFTFYLAVMFLIMQRKEAQEAAKKDGKKKRRKHRRAAEDEGDNDGITRFYRNYVSKLFLHNGTRALIIVLFIGLIAFSAYEVTTIQQGIQPEDAVAEDSFVTAYLKMARVHFQEKVAEMNVVFYDTQLSRSTRRELIEKVIDGMKEVPHVMANYENPWETFDAYLKENNVEPEEASGVMFYYYLLDCVQKNKRIVEHIDINMTQLSVAASKVKFSIEPDAVSDLEIGEETLLKTREVLKNFTKEYGQFMHVSSYSSMWPYYDMVGITFKETVVNLLTSALAVMIVLAVMLPLGPAFIAVCVVLLTDVSILAWIPITGLNLNAITSTCMVMSVGIAVDFTAHITHAFVETDGAGRTGGERAAIAVSKMGRSLTTSALTTFLAVLMLSTVPVPSNRAFFTMMSGVVVFGPLYGLLLLPVILSLINPSYEEPVKVDSPMTPLPPDQEAEELEKTRSRGVRRHHRKRGGDEEKEQHEENGKRNEKKDAKSQPNEKEKDTSDATNSKTPAREIEMTPVRKLEMTPMRKQSMEAISEGSDADFTDARSYDSDGSKLLKQMESAGSSSSDSDDDLPVEKPVEKPVKAEQPPVPAKPLLQRLWFIPTGSTPAETTPAETTKPQPNPSTAIKRFHRPRELAEEEKKEEEKKKEEEEAKEMAQQQQSGFFGIVKRIF